MSGELADLERQSRAQRVTLVHIDAVLALFAPEVDPEALPARRPRKDASYPSTTSTGASSASCAATASR